MGFQRVESSRGWTWITKGWEIFMKNPGIWIVLALILGLINIALSWIPLLGGLAVSLLGPAFFGGLVYGARELDHDRSLEIPHLFRAFQDSERTVPMVLLGLVPLTVSLVVMVFAAMFAVGVAGTAMMTGSEKATAGMALGGGLLFFLLVIAGWIISSALLLFSVPRVMFGHAEPLSAVKDSVQAVMANLGAFFVLVLITVGLAILAVIPFGLGFLLLLPVMAGAVYSANKEVFGAADPTDKIPVSGEPPSGPPEPETPVEPEGGSEAESPAEESESGGEDDDSKTRS